MCTPVGWTIITKFFLFNYGLHALTVISQPGDGLQTCLYYALLSLLLPYSGLHRALKSIRECANAEPNDLSVALKAGALCMAGGYDGLV
jgi:hypothetical protein